MTFVVGTRKLERLPQWVKVSEVFARNEDAPFLERAGIERVNDPRYTRYSQRLARLRDIRKYVYRMDVLERSLTFDEVTEIFVRVNSLGSKLRSSDLALAQITAKWRGAPTWLASNGSGGCSAAMRPYQACARRRGTSQATT